VPTLSNTGTRLESLRYELLDINMIESSNVTEALPHLFRGLASPNSQANEFYPNVPKRRKQYLKEAWEGLRSVHRKKTLP